MAENSSASDTEYRETMGVPPVVSNPSVELEQLFLTRVLPHLCCKDVVALQGSCKAFRQLLDQHPEIWQRLAISMYPEGHSVLCADPSQLRSVLCRHAEAGSNTARGTPRGKQLCYAPAFLDAKTCLFSSDVGHIAFVGSHEICIYRRDRTSFIWASNLQGGNHKCHACRELHHTEPCSSHAWGAGISSYKLATLVCEGNGHKLRIHDVISKQDVQFANLLACPDHLTWSACGTAIAMTFECGLGYAVLQASSEQWSFRSVVIPGPHDSLHLRWCHAGCNLAAFGVASLKIYDCSARSFVLDLSTEQILAKAGSNGDGVLKAVAWHPREAYVTMLLHKSSAAADVVMHITPHSGLVWQVFSTAANAAIWNHPFSAGFESLLWSPSGDCILIWGVCQDEIIIKNIDNGRTYRHTLWTPDADSSRISDDNASGDSQCTEDNEEEEDDGADTRFISACAFNPDGRHVAIATPDGKVAVINLPSVLLTVSLTGCRRYFRQKASITHTVHSLPAMVMPAGCMKVQWTACGLDLVVWDGQASPRAFTVISF